MFPARSRGAGRATQAAGTSIRVAALAGLTATTASLARRLRTAIDTRPTGRVPGAAAACDPAAVRAQSRQDLALPWRLAHRLLARFAVAPFRQRPGFRPLTVLVVDHGPGGLVAAIAGVTPGDTTIVAMDATPGMGALASLQVARLERHDEGARIGWACGDTGRLPVPDGTFDLVVAAGALHGWGDPEKALAEIRRALAPGGRVVILDLRRDLPSWAWVAMKSLQRLLGHQALRAIDEPSASVRAAYREPELQWFAARAKFPPFRISARLAWILLDAGPSEVDGGRPGREGQL